MKNKINKIMTYMKNKINWVNKIIHSIFLYCILSTNNYNFLN